LGLPARAGKPTSGDNQTVLPMRKARNLVLVVGLMSAAGCGGSESKPARTARVSTPTTASVQTTSVPTTSVQPPATARQHRKRRVPAARTPPPRIPPPNRSVSPPGIISDPIPFGPRRRAETAAYVSRHYGSFMQPTWRLTDPRVIVIHYTDSDFASAFATFATDVPDAELHELPGTCAHFLIDTAGTIHWLVPLDTICRHTVGLNWTAIGIEQVGFSDAEVLGNRQELAASLGLVRWLQCRFHIPTQNVIGHNESLSSPFHREDVAALRNQTHSDFNRADMEIYRARLRHSGCG
jgi:N-acetylmuramoyl-L-alanine amidase